MHVAIVYDIYTFFIFKEFQPMTFTCDDNSLS